MWLVRQAQLVRRAAARRWTAAAVVAATAALVAALVAATAAVTATAEAAEAAEAAAATLVVAVAATLVVAMAAVAVVVALIGRRSGWRCYSLPRSAPPRLGHSRYSSSKCHSARKT